MARVLFQRRLVRWAALGVLLVTVLGTLGLAGYQRHLRKSERLEYRAGTLEYWLLAPDVLRRVPPVEPVGGRLFVYEFQDCDNHIEVWNRLSYRSGARQPDLDEVLFRHFEAEGYVEDPDRGHLERELDDEYSQLSYALEPVDGGTGVIVSHVVVGNQKTSIWTKLFGWVARFSGTECAR